MNIESKNLIRDFQEKIKSIYKPSVCKRFIRVLKELSETEINYLEQSNESELIKKLFNKKTAHTDLITERTYLEYMSCLKRFYEWLKSKNYIQESIFLSSNRKIQRTWYNDLKNYKQALKMRHYSTDEIIKSYEKYQKTILKSYDTYRKRKDSLLRFIKFVNQFKTNLYKVDKKLIKQWQDYLISTKHMNGKHYTPYSISRKILHIKKFYEWFTEYGYRKDNPLYCYNSEDNIKSLTKLCSTRKSVKLKREFVPESFQDLYNEATQYEESLNLTEQTINHHKTGWRFFFKYLRKLKINDITKVTEVTLTKYQIYLSNYVKDNGHRLSLNVIIRYLASIKRLFYFLTKMKYISYDYSINIEYPKNPRGLPTCGIKDEELRSILTSAKGDTSKSIRDRAILETLFSTGVRRNELINIKVKDIDFELGFIRINVPKGGANYQRVIPIGKEACYWIQRYIKKVRSCDPKQEYLFLTMQGEPLEGRSVLNMIKSYVIKSKVRNNKITTHSFRVACATGMLKGKGKNLQGASIKFVQEQLGHSTIATTEKYLRLVPSDLKKIHNLHHPRERLNLSDKICSNL